MATLFISDLHLSHERPDKLVLFYQLLSGPALRAEALYILGDLFEVWVGDDDTTPPCPDILAALAAFSHAGAPLRVMHGNRDFLMGSRFESLTGCALLPETSVIDLYGEKTLLLHGDTLCTADLDYQAFRRQVRDPNFQLGFLARPLAERLAMAKQIRNESRMQTSQKEAAIMDVSQEAVEQSMTEHSVLQLIHGHTHRPAIHEFSLNGRDARRIVLGDWYQRDIVLLCDERDQKLMAVTELLAAY